jgi:predicted small lipoprotein YifL
MRQQAVIRKLSALALLLATLISMTGCGQKGPLYLPDEDPVKKESR